MLYKNIFFLEILLFKYTNFFKIWRVVNFYCKIWRFVENLIQNLTRKNFNSESETFWKNFSEIWFLFCFSGFDWVMISFCRRQNSPLNVWGIALWQHTVFTEPLERTLWSIKSSRSAVFHRKHICEGKKICTLLRILSVFSHVPVWATRRRRAMERIWHLHSIYPILDAGRYLPQSWHLSKVTMLNRKSNLKTCVAQNIPKVSYKIPNFKLIVKNCRIKACHDA